MRHCRLVLGSRLGSPMGMAPPGPLAQQAARHCASPESASLCRHSCIARAMIMQLASRVRLPAVYLRPETAHVGGLLAYGPGSVAIFRQLAGYASRILSGALPAYLPVAQPARFELVINLKTARALGLKLPQPLLLRADGVIE